MAGHWSRRANEPFITNSTINKEVYAKECIGKRLIPFINKYKSLGYDVMFWLDLASSHYAKNVVELLDQESINFVTKEKNGPNIPQARPIENFKAICKQEYAKRPNPCDFLSKFEKIWKKLSFKVAKDHGKTLFENFSKNLYQIGHNGVYSLK